MFSCSAFDIGEGGTSRKRKASPFSARSVVECEEKSCGRLPRAQILFFRKYMALCWLEAARHTTRREFFHTSSTHLRTLYLPLKGGGRRKARGGVRACRQTCPKWLMPSLFFGSLASADPHPLPVGVCNPHRNVSSVGGMPARQRLETFGKGVKPPSRSGLSASPAKTEGAARPMA